MSNPPGRTFQPSRNRPASPHSNRRYYASRVKESLTGRATKCICSFFLTLLLICAVIAFVLWLSLRPHRPRFHIEGFSIPGIKQDGGFQNTAIAFNFTIRNPNQNIGIYYDQLQAQVYYRETPFGGTSLGGPFYQGPKNTTVMTGRIDGTPLTGDNPVWQMVLTDRFTGTVVFRFDITAMVRSKVAAIYNGRRDHTMHVDCQVEVGPDGVILPTSVDRRCPVYFY
ncbi:unnamed protein product [Victoria cruziana]